MLSGEDFGYLKEKKKNQTILMVKKLLVFAGISFSIACFRKGLI